MKRFKVVTTSSLLPVPERKTVFEAPLLDARKTAAYRARKYQGSSMIFAPVDENGQRLLVETHLRDGEVIS